MKVSSTSKAPAQTGADTIVVPLFEDEGAPAPEVAALLASGEARRTYKSLALTHDARGRRWLTIGLGKRSDQTAERARVAAATVLERARELSTRTLCWGLEGEESRQSRHVQGLVEVAGALVEGTVLADYRFDKYKSDPDKQAGASKGGAKATARPTAKTKATADAEPPKQLESLIISTAGAKSAAKEIERAVADAAVVADAVNEARDLQNRPGNDLTPSALAAHAKALAAKTPGLSVEVEGSAGLKKRKMGAFAAVAQGSEQEPALIVLRYSPPRAKGPLLGLVGKAVTFDSGGISLKPGAKMSEMKFDMSGGAAVIGAMAAIARLKLPVKLVAVVGATENLPDGRAIKPGDIVTAANGKTIEINNTDAEGRLVLADCLCRAIDLGAERIVDLATLTGAVIIALGSTYAGLMSNDEEWAQRVSEAGERTGEIVWRLPLHEEYDRLIEGTYADLDNAPEGRKAGTIVGASFLKNFIGETPWAHLDIAGSAWDLGRAYAPKSASGYGVRLLVELARSFAT
jgi:leucyl aminopeptidase